MTDSSSASRRAQAEEPSVECILPPVCPVPAGVFTMGSDKGRDKQAYDDEMRRYPVEVDGFAIS
jgi:formylglycine-generating enzyme required for sulfatase activity